jgi:hypothetical protein
LFLNSNIQLMANENPDRPKSPEELELEKQAAIAKLKKDIADSEKGIADSRKGVSDDLKGQLKGPDVTALPGNITSDGTFIESHILTRKTLAEAFRKLGRALEKAKPLQHDTHTQLLIIHSADLPVIDLYVGMETQLAVLQKQYAAVLGHCRDVLRSRQPEAAHAGESAFETATEAAPDTPRKVSAFAPLAAAVPALAALSSGPLAVGYAGAAILRTAIDVASLFRVNTDFKNFDVTVDDFALAAGLREVIPETWKLWDAGLFPANTIKASHAVSSTFLNILTDIQLKSGEASVLLDQINERIKALTAAVTAETDPRKQQPLKMQLDNLTACAGPVNTLNTTFTQVQAAITAVDTTTRTSPLMTILRAERLIQLMKMDHLHIIKLEAVSKGSNKVTTRLWRSAVIRHSAGTELSCVILNADGEIIFSQTQLAYTPYLKSDRIRAQ